uniref:RHS repeat domain-containing protein n=1 Tax=Hoylesella shahii TaxID=228603 RepID=UPI0028E3DAC8
TRQRFTKHYFIGDRRVASKIGAGIFQNAYGHGANVVTAGQKDYQMRMMQIEKQREDYYRKLGTPPGVPTMKGATAEPENTHEGYNSIIKELGDHSVPDGWIQRPKRNAVPGTPPGPPVQWDKAEDPDDVQPGYGYVPADTMHEDIFFYHSDHLGSTSYITDAKANVTQFDAYLPFGELLVDEHSSTEEMPYKFNGKELDQETGLYYYGARYMNPKTSLWYGVDPLAEKYPSVYSYCYTFNNPVKIIDPDGKEPIKPQAGTAQGFVNKLNTTGTKSGTKHGKAAHNAMLGFGKMEFHFPRPLPANTGKINNYRDKYIYTTKGGWLDMAHFMFYAGKAYQYKIQKQEAKKQLEDTWGMAFLPIEMQREILKRSLQDPVGEAVQAGYFQEKTDEIVAKHSAYSYEDLPSDKFGAEFGANYFNPDSKLSLGEQLYNYLEGLGATDPQNSPNYQILPSKEPNKKPSRTNRTTTPVFTKKNP